MRVSVVDIKCAIWSRLERSCICLFTCALLCFCCFTALSFLTPICCADFWHNKRIIIGINIPYIVQAAKSFRCKIDVIMLPLFDINFIGITCNKNYELSRHFVRIIHERGQLNSRSYSGPPCSLLPGSCFYYPSK